MEKLQFKDPAWSEALCKLLSYIQDRTGEFCVIAGGAVRDGILGGSVRDIDIYVDNNSFNAVEGAVYGPVDPRTWYDTDPNINTFQQGEDEYDHQYIWVQKEDASGDELRSAIPALSDYPINLIGVNAAAYGAMIDGKSIVSLFNLTTSQCYIDYDVAVGGWVLGYSEGFRISHDAHLCRILRTSWGREGTVRTATKFLEKYPSFALDIPNYGIYREGEWRGGLSAWLDNAGVD